MEIFPYEAKIKVVSLSGADLNTRHRVVRSGLVTLLCERQSQILRGREESSRPVILTHRCHNPLTQGTLLPLPHSPHAISHNVHPALPPLRSPKFPHRPRVATIEQPLLPPAQTVRSPMSSLDVLKINTFQDFLNVLTPNV